ncbi:hypothetical protein BVC80_9097g233 [Macleaya cordata]|uniref:Uncharacterized protein n=1 Tax=Macleaya cordata TaxID=56857 RepID=A0A200QF59_MACCD|nr:hypothetical protein BVC80_9097g233 [Macleaya cordata]
MRNKQLRSKNESFCEKSMKTVVNIIKLSSLSLAQMSLMRTTSEQPPTSKTSTEAPLVPVPHHHQVHPGSQRSQEPETGSSKSSTYLLETYEGKGSSYVIGEGTNVDGRASDYIRRIHEKNRNDTNNNMVKLDPYILPPPPRLLK